MSPRPWPLQPGLAGAVFEVGRGYYNAGKINDVTLYRELVRRGVKPDAVTFEDAKEVAIGRRVRVVFQDVGEAMALPQFTLTDEPPQGRVWRLPE